MSSSTIVINEIPFYPWYDEKRTITSWLSTPYLQSNEYSSIIGFHISNILNNLKITNQSEIDRFFVERTNYCIACGQLLDFPTQSEACCGNKKCTYDIEEILVGNYVTEMCRDNPFNAVLQLWMASQALYSNQANQILEPHPLFFIKKKVLLQRGEMNTLLTSTAYQDMDRLKKLMPVKDISNIITQVGKFASYSTDQELSASISIDCYRWIRFILMSSKVKLSVSVHYPDIMVMKNEAVFFKVDTDPIDDKQWTSSTLLYHGSSPFNWFSILRNGLKSLSTTKLQRNGAVSGSGIYLSDLLSMSKTYSGAGVHIIGLFQTKKPPSSYQKRANVFVVPNNADVRLRGIMFYPSSSCCDKKMFFDMKTLSSSPSTDIVSSKKNSRLMKEFIQLKNNSELSFNFELQNDNLYLWNVTLPISNFDDQSSPLVKDMIKYNVNDVCMEISFTERYPFHPPFVRVVSPRFQTQTGHITSGGSICMEILCVGHWSPACTLESLIIQIKVLIIEGGARLDMINYKKGYTLDEAEKSFTRVAKVHGWM